MTRHGGESRVFEANIPPESLTDTSAIVIGGGFGGLSSAAYLAAGGADVTVVEKNEQLGGRASVLERDGFRFDMGPSWYLMPDVFDRFFGHFDRTTDSYYELTQLDPQYRIVWKDGDVLDISPDLETNKRRFDAYEPGAGNALEDYLEAAAEQYTVGMEHFVYEDRERLRDFLDVRVLRNARGLSLLGSMQSYVERYFTHPKLQQVMQYSLVFLGGSPGNTPALYTLMSHVDFTLGVYYPTEGMGAVVDAVTSVGDEHGVEFVTETPISAIRRQNGSVHAQSDDGVRFDADVVVSNADYAHTELELLSERHRQYDPAYWESRTYAPSALVLYFGVEGAIEPLAHHTLVLPTDWSSHFTEIFDEPAWPTDPAYYLCVPSKTDHTVAPDGHSALFALVPIAREITDRSTAKERLRAQILEEIAAHCGVDLRERIVFEAQFCIDDFANRYNSYEGTALGLAHTLRQTALFRPNRRSSALDGLYYTGSYTTPGIGVPMCLISGLHTARAIRRDR